MGMSSHVIGLKPVDEKWKKMYAAYKACDDANVDPPKKVLDFFNGVSFEHIEQTGIEVDLEEYACCTEYSGDMKDGYEVDVKKLPKDVTIIRFYNSY